MTDLQRDYHKMFIVVSASLKKYIVVWQSQQAVVNSVNQLDTYINDLEKLYSIKLLTLSGIYESQHILREQLTAEGFLVKEALRLHFTFAGMTDEAGIFTYSIWHLKGMRKNDFYLAVLQVWEQAVIYAQQISAFFITAQQIADMGKHVSDFYKIMQNAEKEEEMQKNATAAIAVKTNECRLLLSGKLDPLINMYATVQPDLVTIYKSDRRLVRSGGKRNYYTVIISGKVYDAKSKTLLDDVSIISETKGKSTVTADRGKFVMKLYKKDAKALHFTLDGYEPLKYTFPAKIKEHKMELKIEMKRKI